MRRGRFSIAKLMGVVCVAAIGLAALRNPTPAWAGAVRLFTGGVLILAVIGAICRTGKDRAGWLGFCLFGWTYALWTQSRSNTLTDIPTHDLLELISSQLGLPPQEQANGNIDRSPAEYWVVGRWLWCLVVALTGGLIARRLFGNSRDRSASGGSAPAVRGGGRKPWRLAATIIALAAFYILMLFLVASDAIPMGPVTGSTFLVTTVFLGAVVLGTVYSTGSRRSICLGAALFGGGYLILAFFPGNDQFLVPRLPTDTLLNVLRPNGPRVLLGGSRSIAAAEVNNRRIVAALEQPVDLPFPNETPLNDILKYIQRASRASDGWEIPIYVDPVALQEAEKTQSSAVQINLKNVPLKIALPLALRQLDLRYRVKDGLLMVTYSQESTPVYEDPFLIVGHCALAVIAGGLGALLAPLVCGRVQARGSEAQP